jgi:hypothetical protein
MFIGSFWRLVTQEQGTEQQDHDPNANRRVGDIKDIKGSELAKMEIEEVDDIAEPHTIDDIAHRAAKHQTEREAVAGLVLAADPPAIEMAAVAATSNQRWVSFCAWASPRLMPKFRTQVKLKIGSNTICWIRSRSSGPIMIHFDSWSAIRMPSAVMYAGAVLCMNHTLAAIAQLAIFDDLGQQAPAAAAFVVVGLRDLNSFGANNRMDLG